MQPTDDGALLRQYAENNSNEAFAALVTRHINLVYSVALRRVANPHHAEEITHAVFIILARKAASLRHDKAPSSWLFQVTRLTANNFIRSESRRHRREGEAYMQNILNEAGTEVWQKIAPLLDDAVAGLREKDRQAVVLRFYEGRSLRDIGLALGASEDAAEKRVNRALEKLRKFFTKRGVSSTTAIIAGTISANSVQAAPVALAKSVTAVAIAKGAVASGSTLTLIKGALKIMAWTKIKTAAVAGIVLILVAGTTTVIMKNYGHRERAKSQWTPAEKESFKQAAIARLTQSKQWAMDCIMFADKHQNRLPKSFEDLKDNASGDFSNWEIVSDGDWKSFTNPSKTILLREKESTQSPNGNFIKAYAFADGHAELVSSPDNDFAAIEEQLGFSVQPAKN